MTDNTPALDLEALRKVAEAATPGPWFYEEDEDALREPILSEAKESPVVEDDYMERHDGRFIATFDPPTVLALLDRITALSPDPARRWRPGGVIWRCSTRTTAKATSWTCAAIQIHAPAGPMRGVSPPVVSLRGEEGCSSRADLSRASSSPTQSQAGEGG